MFSYKFVTSCFIFDKITSRFNFTLSIYASPDIAINHESPSEYSALEKRMRRIVFASMKNKTSYFESS